MMKLMQGRSARGAAATLLIAAVTSLTLFGAGCGDNAGNPTGYFPEGQASPAILLTDVQPLNADTTQVFVVAWVASPPPSDGFRFYVNPDEAGYRPASDVPIVSTTTFTSGWSLFQTSLDGYDPTTTSLALIARGARGGIESSAAPVTSSGYIPASSALALTRRQTVTLLTVGDSLVGPSFEWEPYFKWASVPGAGSYGLQAASVATEELGLLVHIPANGAPPTELDVSVQDRISYYWWVTAYDGGGRAFAISTRKKFSYFPTDEEGVPAIASQSRVRDGVRPVKR